MKNQTSCMTTPVFGRFISSLLMGSGVVLAMTASATAGEAPQATTLLDVSGLTWIEEDLFLGVHDAKNNPKKRLWPRVSLIRLPQTELHGVDWQVVDLEFPGKQGRSSDMESISRIPGNRGFLLCESGQEGPKDRRIFHAAMHEGKLSIESFTNWPVIITNVEATEAFEVNEQLYFMYAERADGLPSTKLRWAKMTLEPLAIGEFSEVTYTGVDPVGKGARPIVGLDIDSDGLIYAVSAFDPGKDDGPYRSVVWRIGRITSDVDGAAIVRIGDAERLANLDGIKVESVTVRELDSGEKQVFVGSDDEHFGGIIRPLPSPSATRRPAGVVKAEEAMQ